MPKYHSKTLALMGIKPRISPSAVQSLDLAERKIGRELPAAVREWYELEGACEFLLEWSNDDPPVEISCLGDPQPASVQHIHDFLVFRWENQGVCVWAIQMDENDDPPVMVAVNPEFNWVQAAASFSQHLYACAWDYVAFWRRVKNDELLIQAQNQPLSKGAWAFLSNRFESEPVTHGWPGHTQYRFFKEDQRILIWASDDQADWYLAAGDEESLERLVNLVGPLDGVLSTFWSNTRTGELFLRRSRK